ncbi:OmpP1/FadL family transporter [Desulfosudis oleivorans]|uniref:Membrane protein involved in aromatic hydrocarbon degradation n=1 Tax=Desulfosudis oleivorans (strain DSM 6200 / JCM 39069 / Hxd3) TaxID=96561 RepID=A8ZVP1_DESOH|nr:outer membrane protein transport protein [Desulfosudis oleivorans]ABW68228.1 membrane protein involved in aromatic hydrocarbon degradation [Desulfosudis oleivorans Hxd3]
MRLFPQIKKAFVPAVLACAAVLAAGHSRTAQAAFFENIAVHAKAISLANSCTAYPPGIMAIHYNPAGLSSMHDGQQVSMGLVTAEFALESRFDQDPEFQDWLGGSFDNADDPVSGHTGTTQGVHMYVPMVGDQDTDAIGLETPLGFTLAAAPFPLGVSYRKPGSRWTFAFGAYAPSLGGYSRSNDDPARYLGRAVSMQHIVYAAPSVSYRITDTLSLGLTIGMGQSATYIDMDMRMPNDLMALTKILGEVTEGLDIPIISALTLPPPWFGGGIGPYEDIANLQLSARDDYCPNYNLGLLWEPKNWFSFGLCYQSEVKMEQDGTYRFTYNENFQRMSAWFGSSPLLLPFSIILDLPYEALPYQTGHMVLEGVDAPQRVQAGIMLRPFKRLRLMCDAHWIDYSKTKAYTLHFDQKIQPFQIAKFVGHTDGAYALKMTRNMEDEIHMSYGAELQVLEWLSLRCGYEERKTSVNPLYFDVMAPVPDLDFYGAGIGIQLKDGMAIDLAFGYLKSDTWHVPNNTSKSMNSTAFTDAVYNPYAGLDVSGKMDATVIAANFSMPFKYVYKLGNMLQAAYEQTKEKMSF